MVLVQVPPSLVSCVSYLLAIATYLVADNNLIQAYGSSRIAGGQVQQILNWPGSFETFRKVCFYTSLSHRCRALIGEVRFQPVCFMMTKVESWLGGWKQRMPVPWLGQPSVNGLNCSWNPTPFAMNPLSIRGSLTFQYEIYTHSYFTSLF